MHVHVPGLKTVSSIEHASAACQQRMPVRGQWGSHQMNTLGINIPFSGNDVTGDVYYRGHYAPRKKTKWQTGGACMDASLSHSMDWFSASENMESFNLLGDCQKVDRLIKMVVPFLIVQLDGKNTGKKTGLGRYLILSIIRK